MGTQLPCPQRGTAPPIFGSCLLWPNGWLDQDATWYGGRPRPRRHCVRWGPISTPQKGAEPPIFGLCCGQMAGLIKLSLGMEVGRGPGDVVFDGDPARPLKRRSAPAPLFGPCLLWPNGWMNQDTTWYGGRPQPSPHCVRWGPKPL